MKPRSKRVFLTVVFSAIVAAGAVIAWQWPRSASPDVAVALPVLPDLSGLPLELQERIHRAHGLAREPARADEGLEELGRLFHANTFAVEAERCWSLLQARQPDNGRWPYYLADLKRNAGDPDGMARLLERTTELAPDYAPAWLQRAEYDFKSGRLAAAAESFRRRLALVPGDPYARLGLARIALQEENAADARTQLAQLVRDAPDFTPARNLYAELLAADGDVAAAEKERRRGGQADRFRQADDPWLDELVDWCYDYDTLCLRGSVDALSNHGDRGKGLFERAIRLRPETIAAYELLGHALLGENEPEQARAVFEEGLAQAPDDPPSAKLYAKLSGTYRTLRQPDEAVRVAREGLERLGEEAELLDALGLALGDRGEREQAIATLRRAVERNPNDAGLSYNLAVALLAAQRLDEAVEALQRSHAAQPTFPLTLSLLAQIEADSGRWQNALGYLRPLYEAQPELKEAREKMAYGYLRAGMESEKNRDLAAAEEQYRAGLAIEREHPELLARLGAFYLLQRRFAEAVAPLETYRRVQPENPQAALYLGQAYAATGRRAEARGVLSEGVRLAERAGNALTAENCRRVLERL